MSGPGASSGDPRDGREEAPAIREFAWADYERVRRLWLSAFGRDRAEPEEDRRCFERNPGLFLVAEASGELVGTTFGSWDGRRGYVSRVAVAPSWRRRGVATALLREVERRLLALGVTTIHLRVDRENDEAQSLYRRLGWTEDGPRIIGWRKVAPGV